MSPYGQQRSESSSNTFVLVSILFLLICFLAYDRYMIEQGKVSPVMHALNFLGLTEYSAAWQGTSNKGPSSNLLAKEKWGKFQQASVLIEKERAEKIQTRLSYLQQMNHANDQVYDEILVKEQDWQNLKRENSKRFLEIAQRANTVIVASKENDLQQRAQKFAQGKSFFWDELTAALPDATDFSEIKAGLAKLEGVALGSAPLPENCPNPRVCHAIAIDDFVRALARLFQNEFNQPQSTLEGLAESVKNLRREYAVLGENLLANDKILQEKKKDCVLMLSVVPQQDAQAMAEKLRQLKPQYSQMFAECQRLLANLDLNRQRVRAALTQAMKAVKKAESVKMGLSPELQGLVDKTSDSLARQTQSWGELDQNEDLVVRLSIDWWQASAMFLDELAVDWAENKPFQQIVPYDGVKL